MIDDKLCVGATTRVNSQKNSIQQKKSFFLFLSLEKPFFLTQFFIFDHIDFVKCHNKTLVKDIHFWFMWTLRDQRGAQSFNKCVKTLYSQIRLKRTARERPDLFVIAGFCYNLGDLFSKSLFATEIFVYYNRVFVLTDLWSL